MGRRLISFGFLLCAAATEGWAAETLFPEPLHLVRRVDDPISGKQLTVEEYCVGNRIISVAGTRTAIADYERQELIEIDRDAATYSVTPFSYLARAATAGAPPAVEKKAAAPLRSVALGSRPSQSGRAVEAFEVDLGSGAVSTRFEVGVDRSIPLSRQAFEVLLGATFPNRRGEHHEAVVQSSAKSSPSGTLYGLPLEQTLTVAVDGERITTRNSILSVQRKLPPPDVTLIPPGARLTESRAVTLYRTLEAIEKPPSH